MEGDVLDAVQSASGTETGPVEVTYPHREAIEAVQVHLESVIAALMEVWSDTIVTDPAFGARMTSAARLVRKAAAVLSDCEQWTLRDRPKGPEREPGARQPDRSGHRFAEDGHRAGLFVGVAPHRDGREVGGT
jgi:hypothetical protein